MSTFAVPLANTRLKEKNVTIVAHVDHGKTSFADSLLSSNNIISQRMAGKLRFLDSREDEQERGITMESSAVALRFDMIRAAPAGDMSQDAAASSSKHVCNVIDTPGHVDFASEVSMASRLCDGALVLVDAVEGVCTQTIAVLRQAWIDRLRPLLVINKLDRLITELKLSPSEAYHHLSQLIEQVNAVMGSFYASDRMEDDLRWREERERRLAQRAEAQADEGANGASNGDEDVDGAEYEEKEDEDIYFAPDRGNVLFASAIDGWAFRLGKFARLYGEKLGIKEANLRKVLWGDWYLDPKTKRVVGRKKLAGRNLKPMFVQFVLENIWRVYTTVLDEYNPDAVQKIVNALSIKVSPRDIKSKDTRNLLTIIMQQWLPLSTATFQAIVDVIPPPEAAQAIRLPYMLHPEKSANSTSPLAPTNALEKALYTCDQGADKEVVCYVSKMFAVRRSELPGSKPKEITADEMRRRGKEERERRAAALAAGQEMGRSSAKPLPVHMDDLDKQVEDMSIEPPAEVGAIPEIDPSADVLLGFSRVFSGTLKRGMAMYAALPKYDADMSFNHPKNEKYIAKVEVKDLYMMMGRELVAVDEVPAGHVCAVAGLDGIVFRNATLWAQPGDEASNAPERLINLAGVNMQQAPIVRVALEPENPSDMPKLVRGLQILNQADPCAEYLVQETGEHVILTAGELHLERCLKDLRERFAKCPIQQSEAIVPFRESAVKAVDMAPPKTKGATRGTVHGSLFDGLVSYTLRASPLPDKIIDYLLANTHNIGKLLAHLQDKSESEEGVREEREAGESQEAKAKTPEQFWAGLEELCEQVGGEWAGAADRIWCFGPKRLGANLLLDPIGKAVPRMRQKEQLIATAKAEGQSTDDAVAATEDAVLNDQLAANGSPANAAAADGNGASEGRRAELRLLKDFESSIETGFQLATFQGPLCSEPVVGMAWTVESVEYHRGEGDDEAGRGRSSAVVGALISSIRDSCRQGLLDWSPRIKLAMYTCDIQASTDVLGKVYGVVARRRGRIVSEEMKEGTAFFTIRAMLPVVESFGFADEIRKRTSGAASPQLIFSGFETLDQDPFWVPTTVEELEDLGEKADRANVAKGYVDAVRKRKGMFVEKKIVEFAEKQRTLKR